MIRPQQSSREDQIFCPRCGQKHRGKRWVHAEKTRRQHQGSSALPAESLGPLRTGPVHAFNLFDDPQAKKRAAKFDAVTWADYEKWCYQEAHEVHPKGTLGVARWTENGRRREIDMARADHVYFDVDGGSTWEALYNALTRAGIRAFFQESSSSAARRTGDPNEPLPQKWHCVIPLARTLLNPLNGLTTAREMSYARSEWKRKYAHVAGVLSAIARMPGVGGDGCGMDLATSQMCSIRFMGCRAYEDGPAPRMAFTNGDKAIDWDNLLVATGYEAAPMPRDREAPIEVQTPTGEVLKYKINSDFDQLCRDVKARCSIANFLETRLGMSAEKDTGHYACMMHAGDGSRTFHVWRNQAGEELWTCHSQCGTGDVVKLARNVWGVPFKEALYRMAREVGLDPESYSTEAEVDDPSDPFLPGSDRTMRIPLRRVVDTEDPFAGDEFLPPRAEDQAIKIPLKVKIDGETVEIPGAPPVPGIAASGPAPEPLVKPTDPVEKPFPGKVRKAPKGVRKLASKQLAKWAKKWSVYVPDHGQIFAKATAKLILLSMGRNAGVVDATGDTDKKKLLYDPREIAAQLWQPAVAAHYKKIQNLEGEIVGTAKLIDGGKRCAGYGWLKRHLGERSLYELCVALRRDGFARAEAAIRSVMGLGLVRGPEADLAEGIARNYRLMSPRSVVPDVKESQAFDRQVKQLINGLRRPVWCGQFKQILTEDGRNLGPSGPDGAPLEFSHRMVCEAKLCPYCMNLEILSEARQLEELWRPRPGDLRKNFHMIEVQGIASKEDLGAIKKQISRTPDPKIGIVGWGPDMKPMLRYFVTTDEAAMVVRSAVEGAVEMVTDQRAKATKTRLKGYQEAIDLAVETKLSYYVHARSLLEYAARTHNPESMNSLCNWLWWSSRKSPVRNPRNEEALRWPTKKALKAAAKEARGEDFEADILDPKSVLYTAVHIATNHVIGTRRGSPFSLDQVIELAQFNASFQLKLNKLTGRGQGGLAAAG